jgi:hypothetical protein
MHSPKGFIDSANRTGETLIEMLVSHRYYCSEAADQVLDLEEGAEN